MKIRQLVVEKDIDDDQHIYTILTDDSRIFVGGIHENKFRWMELPPPTEKNTKWIGDGLASPFRPDEKIRG